MAMSFPGAMFNLSPGQLTQAFAPVNKNLFSERTIEEAPVTSGIPQGVDPTIAYIFEKNKPRSQASELKELIPFINQLDEARAERATKLARQKLGDEALIAGIGALAKGVETSIAGGSPEMLAFLAQAPMRNASSYMQGLGVYPRQEIPMLSTQPITPNRKYFA